MKKLLFILALIIGIITMFITPDNPDLQKCPLPALAVMAIASAISMAMKAGTAAYQRHKAKKLEEQYKRPDYEIPESLKSSLSEAQRMASGFKMPGQDIMESGIKESTAGGVERLKELAGGSAGVLGGVANLYGSEQKRMQDLNQFAAQSYTGRNAALRSELKTMAGAEQQKWQFDKADPYLAAMRAASALKGASIQNWDRVANTGSDFASMYGRYLYADQMMGAGGTKSATDTGAGDMNYKYNPLTRTFESGGVNPFTGASYGDPYSRQGLDYQYPEALTLKDKLYFEGQGMLPYKRQ